MYQCYAFVCDKGSLFSRCSGTLSSGARWRLRFVVAPDEQLWVSFLVPSTFSTRLDSRRYRPRFMRLPVDANPIRPSFIQPKPDRSRPILAWRSQGDPALSHSVPIELANSLRSEPKLRSADAKPTLSPFGPRIDRVEQQ